MSYEMSPRNRTAVSGLAAVATTVLLMTTVIESLNPAALNQSLRESAGPAIAANVDLQSDALLFRRV
ncbi:MAG: hypothetical protein WAW79_07995 [Steroidobacteraceae bacterium]